MRWVAFMPLRANSKSIPDKNIRDIAGRPLFSWSLEQAIISNCFDEIYVASDSLRIQKKALDLFSPAVKVIDRSAENCTDSASTESAMIEFQDKVSFDVVCLIQATSPLTCAADFCAAKEQFLAENLDSLLTVVPSKRFFWTESGRPINYNPVKRPRRQDFDGQLMENGAFYFTKSKILAEYGSRLAGHIGLHKMSAENAIELDDESDWHIIEQLLLKRKRSFIDDTVSQVKVLVVDVDGTLTDGGMYYGADGEELKKFNTRDAHGLQTLHDHNIRICVISGETSPSVSARIKKLRIEDFYPGIKDKLLLLKQLESQWGISLQNFAYIGDDLCDLDPMRNVGVSFCPSDAVPQITQQADYICKKSGGNGAVREVCDLILQTKQKSFLTL